MKRAIVFLFKLALVAVSCLVGWWAATVPVSSAMNLAIIVGGVLIVFPFTWLGRKVIDRHYTMSCVTWITTSEHCILAILFGVAIARAIITHRDWSGWLLPVPPAVGFLLFVITGAALLFVIINLALKGLGAPFYIAFSRKLAVDWLYAWTRNPMFLGILACLLSLGIWFQSVLFVLWALVVFAPAYVFFVRVYEERELEFRFGSSYLEYKSRTPMWLPRRPKR
jgi:protein-S-isoprenylcysteine O-methyltransferase Ste14